MDEEVPRHASSERSLGTGTIREVRGRNTRQIEASEIDLNQRAVATLPLPLRFPERQIAVAVT